jgi:hypothetical protein
VSGSAIDVLSVVRHALSALCGGSRARRKPACHRTAWMAHAFWLTSALILYVIWLTDLAWMGVRGARLRLYSVPVAGSSSSGWLSLSLAGTGSAAVSTAAESSTNCVSPAGPLSFAAVGWAGCSAELSVGEEVEALPASSPLDADGPAGVPSCSKLLERRRLLIAGSWASRSYALLAWKYHANRSMIRMIATALPLF